MGVTTIGWTATKNRDGTWSPGFSWNPWRGCFEISPACDNCYAMKMSYRNPKTLGEWGEGTYRAIAAESYWQLPFKWDKAAAKAGERRRVFSLSLGDWLEDRPDLDPHLLRMLDTIHKTPNLDWLLLTKRPEVWRKRIKVAFNLAERYSPLAYWLLDWFDGKPPANVWIGATVENHADGFPRLGHLRQIPAAVRFISAEPLLESIADIDLTGIDWVIIGGESGKDARPFHLNWARELINQCMKFGAIPFVKQFGNRPVYDRDEAWHYLYAHHGADPSEWPTDLQVQEFPDVHK